MTDETKVADVLEVEDGQKVIAEEPAPAVSKDGEEADPQADAKPGEETEDRPRRKGGWLRKLERQERETEFWREQALRNQSKGEVAKDTKPEIKHEDKGPLLDNYIADGKSYEQWADDRFRWNESRQQQASSQAEAQERSQEIERNYRDRMLDFSEEHDDFNQVVGRVELNNEIAPAVQVSLMEDENGPALAYYLGQHPETVEQLNNLSAAGAARYIGRLAERLFPEADNQAEDQDPEEVEAPTPRTPKPAVAAPVPLKPVKKPAPTATGLNDDLSTEEWMRRREKQTRK